MSMPTVSEGLCQLLLLLSRGASHDDVLRCRANSGRILGARELYVRADQVSDQWIPSALLVQAETSSSPWSVDLAVRTPGMPGLTIAVLGARFRFRRVYENPQDRSRKFGRRWIWPEREIAAAITRAEGFLPPTMIVDARAFVLGLWSLSCPLRGRADDSAIKHLFMRVAERVGADVVPANVRLDDLQVPIPGFPVANATADADVVRCPELHLERVYSLPEVEGALTGPTSDTHSTPPAAPAHRRRER